MLSLSQIDVLIQEGKSMKGMLIAAICWQVVLSSEGLLAFGCKVTYCQS